MKISPTTQILVWSFWFFLLAPGPVFGLFEPKPEPAFQEPSVPLQKCQEQPIQHKKIKEISHRTGKKIRKAFQAFSIFSSERTGLLADNRIYFGLLLIGGGLVLSLVFGGLIDLVATLGILMGLGLIIWALIEGSIQ